MKQAPPHNEKVERSVLGALFAGSNAMEQIENLVSADDFYLRQNQLIFKAMESLCAKNKPIDVITVCDELRNGGQLENAKGEDYVLDLPLAVVSAQNIVAHAKLVREKASLRELMRTMAEVTQSCYEQDGEAPEIIKGAADKIEALGQKYSGSGEARITSPHDYDAEVSKLYVKGVGQGLTMGYPEMDTFLTIAPGTINIIYGWPGGGKSEFMDNIMLNMSDKYRWRWFVCSPENYPPQIHVVKMIERRKGASFFGHTRMGMADVNTTMNWLQKHFRFVNLHEENNTHHALLDTFKQYAHNFQGMVADPWNEFEYDVPKGMKDTDYIGRMLSRYRRFARANQIALFIVAHPQKPGIGKKADLPIPLPYMLFGSSHFWNKADNIIAVHWPDKKKSETDILFQKVKFKFHGHPGQGKLYYQRSTGRYYDHKPADQF